MDTVENTRLRNQRQGKSGRTDGEPRQSEPFAALPHSIAGDPTISPTEKAVLLALLYWARDKATCWPSNASIAARIGRSPGQVGRLLKSLEAKGLISRAPADNPTWRVIRLRWRAGVSAPEPPCPSARPVSESPPGENEREKEPASVVEPPRVGTTPAGDRSREPAAVSTAELLAWAEGDNEILRRIGRAALGIIPGAAKVLSPESPAPNPLPVAPLPSPAPPTEPRAQQLDPGMPGGRWLPFGLIASDRPRPLTGSPSPHGDGLEVGRAQG